MPLSILSWLCLMESILPCSIQRRECHLSTQSTGLLHRQNMSDLQTEHAVVYYDKYLSFKRNTETFVCRWIQYWELEISVQIIKPLIAVRGSIPFCLCKVDSTSIVSGILWRCQILWVLHLAWAHWSATASRL